MKPALPLLSRLRPFGLLRWFSVLSLLSIGLACILSPYLLSRFLTQHMLHRDAVLTQEFVQRVADIEFDKTRAAGQTPSIRDANMQGLLDHFAGVPDTLRTNIYAPDQTLVWSSEKILIGKRFDDNPELVKALSGEIEFEMGETSKQQHPKHEHMFLSDRPVSFVEMYLPIRDNKRVIAVAEIYRLPHALFDTIERGRWLIWINGIFTGVFLYFVLFWIVRRSDATIRSQQSRLIESETLSAVGEMSAAVAHGIRNPLASIRSSAELCLDDQSSPQVRESVSDIVAQVDRKEKWVRDLLNYAQPESRNAEQVKLDTLIWRVCDDFARDFEKQFVVSKLSLPDDLPLVAGDRVAFEQVFFNVLTNAMQAMPKGGEVTIRARMPLPGAPVVIVISDTGVGISEAHKAKLFVPFQTTKAKGMGLGLALVRRILHRFGGEVQIRSAPGTGTQVELSFLVASQG